MCEELHDPFQDQVACARYKAERDMLAQAMERVADDIERTFLGFEGAEDAPAMRWAREFRAALGSLHAPVRDTTMSAYDLLPEDEREAIAWVREHGGIAYVKDAWNVRSNLDRQLEKAQAKVERQQRHIESLQGKLSERRVKINVMCAQMAEMRPRLVPEGMEWLVEAWPRFEDDAPVILGDEISWRDDGGAVNSIELQDGGYFILHAADGADDWIHPQYFPGERVKRPAPKVLDADGEEIELGDDLYGCESGRCPFRVSGVLSDSAEVKLMSYLDGGEFTICAATFTHRAPVLAADGEPLEVGQTVWDENGDEFRVLDLYGGPVDEDFPDHTVRCRRAGAEEYESTMCAPYQLTHQRPETDSWKRLEDDATKQPYAYCVEHGLDDDDSLPTNEKFARDLVRRAKAMAGVSE